MSNYADDMFDSSIPSQEEQDAWYEDSYDEYDDEDGAEAWDAMNEDAAMESSLFGGC